MFLSDIYRTFIFQWVIFLLIYINPITKVKEWGVKFAPFVIPGFSSCAVRKKKMKGLISMALLHQRLVLIRKFAQRGFQVVTRMNKLRPIVLSGPSGSGKSTVIKKLMEEYPTKFGFSVSHTTRQPRTGEVNGRDYHYTDLSTITKQIENGEFIEHAVFSNNTYGTSKKAVQDVLDSGKICIMDLDSQGVRNVKEVKLDCVLIFIKPPSLEELERRLRSRGTETEDAIQRRLATCEEAMRYASIPDSYHYIIVNDVLEKAYSELKNVITKEITTL